jgi:CRP/FNR family transcriptional regulator, cyclic AMP receptor protein
MSDWIECPCDPICATDSGILSGTCPLLHSPLRTSLLGYCADRVLAFKHDTPSLGAERLMKRMNQLASHLGGFSSGASLGGKLSRYGGKQNIYTQGAPAHTVFYILEGGVCLTTRSKYQPSAVTAILGMGDFFGELCLVGFPHHVSTAVALTTSSILVIKKESMMRMLRQKNKMSNSFVSYLLSSIRKYQNHVAELLTSPAEQRLARVLLRLAHLDRRDLPNAGLPTVSQQVLAEMVGTTRSRLNFFMNRFRKQGFISHKGRIKVHKSLQKVLRRGRGSAPNHPPILGGSRLCDPRSSKLSAIQN